jgi:hypothetical protein
MCRGFDHFRHDPDDLVSIAATSIRGAARGTGRQPVAAWTMSPGDALCAGRNGIAPFANRLDDPDSVGADTLNAVFEDDQGRIWVGAHAGGLARSTGKRKVRHYRADPGKPACGSATAR